MTDVVEVSIDMQVCVPGTYAPYGRSSLKFSLTREQIAAHAGKNLVKSAILCALLDLESKEKSEEEDDS
jgi:hypothetical protein